MKRLFILTLFLSSSAFVFSQVLETVVKPGTQLFYRIDTQDKHYDFVATVTQLHPFNFTWQIIDSANATGAVTQTARALRKGTVVSTVFSAGEAKLDNKTTSLLLSQKCFRQFIDKRGKPITMQLGNGGERIGMGTYTGINDFEIKINGTAITIKEESVKPLLKLGKKYTSTGDEMLTFYNSAGLPIILRMRTTYYMELLSISNK